MISKLLLLLCGKFALDNGVNFMLKGLILMLLLLMLLLLLLLIRCEVHVEGTSQICPASVLPERPYFPLHLVPGSGGH